MNAIKFTSPPSSKSPVSVARRYLTIFSWTMIAAFLNFEMGCRFTTSSVLENGKYSGDRAEVNAQLAEISNLPVKDLFASLQKLHKGEVILISTKEYELVKGNFHGYDSTNIYIKSARKVDQAIPLASVKTVEKLKDEYLILRSGAKSWHITQASLNEKKSEMYFTTEPLPDNYQLYRNRIHIYVSRHLNSENGRITVPYTSIKKLKIYEGKKGVPPVVIVIVTLAAVTTLIAAIAGNINVGGSSSTTSNPPPSGGTTTHSCPYVYLKDPAAYRFVGEMYGGAIYPSLERDDYMPLPRFTDFNDEYQLTISNELHEIQHTNLAELIVVNHPPEYRVLLDKYGHPQTISHLSHPVEAFDNAGLDQRYVLSAIDSSSYLFNMTESRSSSLSDLTLTFARPTTATKGKLVLHAKNSAWLDFIITNFTRQFGTSYTSYSQKQQHASVGKHMNWFLNQGLPLSIYIETDHGWKFIDYIDLIGPMAARDVVVPINFANTRENLVKIKLECGFMFWEVDYAAMDFSKNISAEIKHISPSSAVDEKGNDVTALLIATDEKYLHQPEIGNTVKVKYPVCLTPKNYTASVFLHGRGHYDYVFNYDNRPNWIKVSWLTRKHGLSHFSKSQFNEFVKEKSYTTAKSQRNDK